MAVREAGAAGRGPSGRDRILDAAYGLFSRSGVRAIGVDTITAEADVAKMTLYRNFASKNDLALAFLALREERWTKGWVQAEATSRGDTPAQQLLAIFEIFSEWFARDDFEGCAFITSLLEFDDREDPVRRGLRRAPREHPRVRRERAAAAGVADPERFAAQWHILMKGSIVARHEGDRDAAHKARELGRCCSPARASRTSSSVSDGRRVRPSGRAARPRARRSCARCAPTASRRAC